MGLFQFLGFNPKRTDKKIQIKIMEVFEVLNITWMAKLKARGLQNV